MAALASGAAFGAAMIAAGFHQPSIVIEQFKLVNFHMLQAFLSAAATSAVIYHVAESQGYVRIPPRSSSPLGLFAKYDGNIIGGSLLGVGMALSGSCPGTLFAQMAAGVRTGFYALDGAILGGIIWTGFLSGLVKRRNQAVSVKPETAKVHDQLGVSRNTALVVFELLCASVITATTVLGPASLETKLSGAAGGVLIGLSQLVSLATRRSLVGISGSYEEFGNLFWSVTGGGATDKKTPRSFQNIMFAVGAGAGAWGLSRAVPSLVAAPAYEVTPWIAALGGILMAVGSRMAGGCTSGHGISGMSLFSTSSIVTIACVFGAATLVAPLAHP